MRSEQVSQKASEPVPSRASGTSEQSKPVSEKASEPVSQKASEQSKPEQLKT